MGKFLIVLFQWGVIALVAGLVITQIIGPLARGTSLFPAWRRREFDARLRSLNDDIEDERVKQEIDRLEDELKETIAKRNGGENGESGNSDAAA